MSARAWLVLALLPYLALAGFDGWLHEKARRVPRLEQFLHALLFVSFVALLFGVFGARPGFALAALAVFVPAACADEFGFHAALERRERRVHHAAYACFAGFVALAFALGALVWPWA